MDECTCRRFYDGRHGWRLDVDHACPVHGDADPPVGRPTFWHNVVGHPLLWALRR